MSFELFHIRKRNLNPIKNLEHSGIKKILDKIAYPIALIGPLSSLDQVIRIWTEKDAIGVSIIVWTTLFFASCFWIFYGIVHREKVIFFGHILWCLLSATIIFEIFLFS